MLKFNNGKTLFFCADTHFGHGNIIKYCNRPFATEEEKLLLEKTKAENGDIRAIKLSTETIQKMDQSIIDNINKVVLPDNHLFILGDFCFNHKKIPEYRQRINCQNLYLILGNHDHDDLSIYHPYFQTYHQLDLMVGNQAITLSHYAMLRWRNSHHGAWHLFGHSHGQLNEWLAQHLPEYKMLDVGLDTHNFTPWSFNEIFKLFQS